MIKCDVGERFGKLVITKTWSQTFVTPDRKQKVCECKCDCGNMVVLRASALRHDGKRQCGCEDGRGGRSLCKIGTKYGKLTILKAWSEKFPHHRSKEKVCECRCDCGKIVVVRGRYLRSNHKHSCGCLKLINNKNHHAWKGHGEISGTFWKQIQKGANRRGRTLVFDITIEQVWDLFLKQNRRCALSGIEIRFSQRNNKHYIEDRRVQTASLDRIDSSKGYTIDNVQWVHKSIQSMKMAMLDKDFIEWCNIVSVYNVQTNPQLFKRFARQPIVK